MWTRIARRRAGLLIALLPTVVIAYLGWKHDHDANAQSVRAAELFGGLRPDHSEYAVQERFGGRGQFVKGLAWPDHLGDIPGYANGRKEVFRAAGHADLKFEFVLSPDTPVWWRVWPVGGGHQWIAVCFLNDGSGGSLTTPRVIAKRSGKSG